MNQEGTAMNDFILNSAAVRAERVLADRRWFVATEEQHDEFVRLLEAPMETPKLADLFAEEPPFGKTIRTDY